LFISAKHDAYEQIDVANTDIPGAFVQTYLVGEFHVKFEAGLLKSSPK